MSTVLRPNWLHCILCLQFFYFILSQFLNNLKRFILVLLLWLFLWLFYFLLSKSLWITIVYELCVINKLAMPNIFVETDTFSAFFDEKRVQMNSIYSK